MAKGQKRSNREVKKPKAAKKPAAGSASFIQKSSAKPAAKGSTK